MAARRHINQLKHPEWLKQQYAKYSTHEIAKQLGCNQRLVWDAIKRFNIPARRKGRPVVDAPVSRYRQAKRNGRVSKLCRHLMEEHFGRRLGPKEHVHHIDGNKLNDSLDNLMVLDEHTHHEIHKKDAKTWMKNRNYICHDKVCLQCGHRFIGNNIAKYCPVCRPRRPK